MSCIRKIWRFKMRICHISDIHWRGIARHEEYTRAFEDFFHKLKTEIKPDIIVNTGDTFHTKTQGITPEIIERLSWMIREMADIAPTYTLLGNHDGNLTNPDRKDVITPIHEATNHPNAFLVRDSGVYAVNNEVDFIVFSPFDKSGWESLKPTPNKISIALFHGTMTGCVMDNNWAMPSGEAQVTDFVGYDFVLMGDIHKHQSMAYRLDENGVEKPWISYAGSFIQQSFGENEEKGFQVWDIRSKGDWDLTFVEMPNHTPFISIKWNNSAEETIQDIIVNRGGLRSQVKPGSRFRIISDQPIPESQERKLLTELKEDFLASDVVFKSDYLVTMDDISTDSLTLSKKSLRDDPESMMYLYEEYLKATTATASNFIIDGENLLDAKEQIKKYLVEFNNTTPEAGHASVWALKWIEFDNIFCYGEGNRVDFKNLDGLVGLFGPNRAGKSSIIAAIMYALFNSSDRGKQIKNIDMINKNKKYCSAKVRFVVNGDDYVVERKTKRTYDKHGIETGKVVNTVDFYQLIKQEDGTEIRKSKNSISTTDSDKELVRLIGSQEDFLLTAFASQWDLNNFIEKGATDRKKHLGRFLQLDIFEKLHDLVKKDLSELKQRDVFLSEEEWEQRVAFNQKQANTTRQQVDFLEESKTPLQEKRDQLKLWILQHENDASRADNQELMKYESKEIELAKHLQAKEEELSAIIKELKNENNRFKWLEKEISSFDEQLLLSQREHLKKLTKLVEDAKLQTDKETESLKRVEKSIKILQSVPCGDSFPTCKFIKDSYKDKDKYDSQKKQVEDLVEKLHLLEKESSSLLKKNVDGKLATLASHQVELTNNRVRSEILTEKQEKIEAQISGIKDSLSSVRSILDEMHKKAFIMDSEESNEKKRELIEVESLIKTINSDITSFNQEIGKINERVKILLQEKSDSAHLYKKMNILTSIQDAFSKTGIPSMILKTQLPAINTEISRILTSIVSFKLVLESDTSSNAMDIYVIDDKNGKRKIEACSGMEKTLCSLAIRVALCNLSSLPRPNFLIIDEGFGALDKDNQQDCINMLDLLSVYFRTVLIISHVEQVKEVANKMIEIKQTKTESKITA